MDFVQTARNEVERVIEDVVHFRKEYNDESVLIDLGIDSLDVVEMTMEIEEELDVLIDDDQMTDLVTVGDMINRIAQILETHKK